MNREIDKDICKKSERVSYYIYIYISVCTVILVHLTYSLDSHQFMMHVQLQTHTVIT